MTSHRTPTGGRQVMPHRRAHRTGRRSRWGTFLAAAVALAAASAPTAALAAPTASELQVSRLPFAATDAVFDPTRDLVYVSVASVSISHPNRVLAVDPATGIVRRSVPVGPHPSTLAVSDDGSALYVGVAGSAELVRVDLARFTVAARVALSAPSHTGPAPLFVVDLEVQPGNAEVVVAAAIGAGGNRVIVVRSQVVDPVAYTDHPSVRSLARSGDPTTFYGYNNASSGFDLITLSVTGDGVRARAASTEALSGFHHTIELSDGRLYSTSGEVVDPAGPHRFGTYAVGGAIEPVPATDRTHVLASDGLHTFHRTRFTPVAHLPFPVVPSRVPGALVATSAGLVGVTAPGEAFLFTAAGRVAPPLFSDVAGDTHRASIFDMVQRGVAVGFDDGSFRPGAPVSRGQMATFLARALRLPPGPSPFADTDGHPHAAAIAAVAHAGIAEGYPDGRFRPDAPVTREQMATFLTRAGRLAPPVDPVVFHDVSGVHERAVQTIAAHRITLGTSPGTFSPTQPVSRGQMATFLSRLLALPGMGG